MQGRYLLGLSSILYILSSIKATPVNPQLLPYNLGAPPQYGAPQPQPFAAPQAPFIGAQTGWGGQQQKKPVPPLNLGAILPAPKKNPFFVVPNYSFGKIIRDTTSSTTTSTTTTTTQLNIRVIKVIKKKKTCCDDNGIGGLGGGLGGLGGVGKLDLDFQKNKEQQKQMGPDPKMVAHLTNKAYQAVVKTDKNYQGIDLNTDADKKSSHDFSSDSKDSKVHEAESLAYKK